MTEIKQMDFYKVYYHIVAMPFISQWRNDKIGWRIFQAEDEDSARSWAEKQLKIVPFSFKIRRVIKLPYDSHMKWIGYEHFWVTDCWGKKPRPAVVTKTIILKDGSTKDLVEGLPSISCFLG